MPEPTYDEPTPESPGNIEAPTAITPQADSAIDAPTQISAESASTIAAPTGLTTLPAQGLRPLKVI